MLPALLLLMASLVHAEPRPAVVDRVVAVVGERLVMASEVELERALATHDPSPVDVLQRRRAAPVQSLIDQAIILELSDRISIYKPTAASVQGRVTALRASFTDLPAYQLFLRSHGLDEDRLVGTIYSHMVVERFVRRNVDLGDDPSQHMARYEEWIALQHRRMLIRLVAPITR